MRNCKTRINNNDFFCPDIQDSTPVFEYVDSPSGLLNITQVWGGITSFTPTLNTPLLIDEIRNKSIITADTESARIQGRGVGKDGN